MSSIPVFVMTIDRPTLPKLVDSLKGADLIMVRGPWAMNRIAEQASRMSSELMAVVEDDAEAPPGWLDVAEAAFADPQLGYVAGPQVDSEEYPAQLVQQSLLGSFVMRDRYRHGEDGDGEDRVPGMGVFRRAAYLAALAAIPETQPKTPGTGQDVRIEKYLKDHGWKVLYLDRMAVRHRSRRTLSAFFRQKFKDGVGRATYLKTFPRECVRKPYFFLPSALLVLVFVWPWGPIGLGCYLALVLGSTRKPSLVPWFLVNHVGYGLGMVWGLLK